MNEERRIRLMTGPVDAVDIDIPTRPEPVYEYRVVCADGPQWWAASYDDAVILAKSLDIGAIYGCVHSVERRLVGSWEAT